MRPQPERSRRTSFYARYVKNWWLVELVSLLWGVAATVALCLVLRNYDGKQSPHTNTIMGIDITLNAFVSFLSTTSRAALLLSVSECISQLKWSWFLDRERPLGDLDVFDEASRGAWGGLQLLWKVNIRQIASFGTLLVIGGLVIDPLSQQLFQYKWQVVPGPLGSATLPVVSDWGTLVAKGESEQHRPQPSLPMKGAIQSGLFTQSSYVSDVQPTCSTGNCTWPSYRSLAICARSADVTSSLRTSNVSVPGNIRGERLYEKEWYLSQQSYILDSSARVLCNLTSVANTASTVSTNGNQERDLAGEVSCLLNFTDSIAFKDSPSPIADVFMIYQNEMSGINHSSVSYSAVEFVLEWCVQTFTTTVAKGVPLTQRHKSFRDFSMSGFFPNLTATPDGGDKRNYTIAFDAQFLLQSYFRDFFHGIVYMIDRSALVESATNDATEALFQPFDNRRNTINGTDGILGGGVGLSGLQRILENIATEMTNMIRTSTMYTNIEQIKGSADELRTFVEIQWGWIAAPIVLSISSVSFFLAACFNSSERQKAEIWKSSSLPLLTALSKELHAEGFSTKKSLSALEDWAQNIPARLSQDADGAGWKLVRRRIGNGKPDVRGNLKR